MESSLVLPREQGPPCRGVKVGRAAGASPGWPRFRVSGRRPGRCGREQPAGCRRPHSGPGLRSGPQTPLSGPVSVSVGQGPASPGWRLPPCGSESENSGSPTFPSLLYLRNRVCLRTKPFRNYKKTATSWNRRFCELRDATSEAQGKCGWCQACSRDSCPSTLRRLATDTPSGLSRRAQRRGWRPALHSPGVPAGHLRSEPGHVLVGRGGRGQRHSDPGRHAGLALGRTGHGHAQHRCSGGCRRSRPAAARPRARAPCPGGLGLHSTASSWSTSERALQNQNSFF